MYLQHIFRFSVLNIITNLPIDSSMSKGWQDHTSAAIPRRRLQEEVCIYTFLQAFYLLDFSRYSVILRFVYYPLFFLVCNVFLFILSIENEK